MVPEAAEVIYLAQEAVMGDVATPAQVEEIANYLAETAPDVFSARKLSKYALETMIRRCSILRIRPPRDLYDASEAVLPSEKQGAWLYNVNDSAQGFTTLVLNGGPLQVFEKHGKDVSEMHRASAWSILALSALVGGRDYVPNFSAKVVHSTRILKITSSEYHAAVWGPQAALPEEASADVMVEILQDEKTDNNTLSL